MDEFTYLGSTITGAARCIHEIRSRIAIAKAPFNNTSFFHRQTGLKFEEDVIMYCIWSIVLYDAEIWTHLKVDQK